MALDDSSIVFASAMSEAADADQAVGEVADALAARIEGPVDLLLAFVTADHRETLKLLHERLTKTWSPRVALGMSSEGVIGIGREVERAPGVSVLAARLPEVNLCAFSYEQIDWQAVVQNPMSLPGMLGVSDEIKLMMMLADPFSTPITRMLPLFNQSFAGVPMVGGMASAARKPHDNRLLYNDRILTQGGVGLLFSGSLQAHCTVSQGCRPIGRPMVITKSQRHVVQQLGGRNAMQVIHDMVRQLNEDERQLVETYGLQVGRVINEYKSHFGRGDFLIRGISGVEEEAGYIGIGDAAVRVGQTVQFHVRDQQTAREDFTFLLEGQKLHGPADGALLFSCNGRGTHLFDRPDTDAQLVRAALGDVPLSGCFAAGEIGPIGGENFLHGHTASLVVFRKA